MKKAKVLNVVSNLSQTNGVSSYVMNYYEHFSQKVEMDFLVLMNLNKEHYEKIKENKIFELFYNEKKNIFSYLKEMDEFFKKHAAHYDIIHCQVANLGLFPLYFAKKYGIKVRIIHSHATCSADKIFNKIRNNIILKFVKRLATDYFACSEAAGVAMFGNKRFTVIENAVLTQKYNYDEKVRNELRKSLNLDDKFIVGHIGRFSEQKNQRFLLDVFKEVVKKNKNAHLLLIGSGPYEEALKQQVSDLSIEPYVTFLGRRNDVERLYQAMDCFILTSFFEGLPVTGIEAQVSGLPCVFSDTITKEVDISNNVKFFSLNDSKEKWADFIAEVKTTGRSKVKTDKNYDIEYATKKLEKIYMSFVDEKKV